MATTYNHAQIGIVDASGNVNVIYPITTGADVSITRTNTKLPTAATTAQALANAFGKLAFADSEISDSVTSTTKTWSSNKINTAITELNSNLSKSFQAGVDTLYNKCVSCGSTPSAKTPTAISTSIQSIYTNRYNTGYNNGKNDGNTSGYNTGYSAGRIQGQNDVKGNPNGYGLYTSTQYNANYTNGSTSMYNSLLTYINMPNFLEYSKLLKFIPPNVMFKNIIVKNKGEKYKLALGSSAFYIRSLHSFYDGDKPLYPGITNQDLRNMDFKMNGEVGINLADDTGFTISGRTAIFTFGERGCTIYEKLTGTNNPSMATTSNVTLYFLFSLG